MKKQITTLKRHTFLAVMILCSSLFLSAQVYKTVELTAGGTLGTVLTPTEISTVTDLTVTTASGVYLADADFATMKSMTVIANIDLSGSFIAATVVGKIPDNTFLNKTSLKSFKFPKNLRDIGASAFTGSGLTGVFTLPASISNIGNLKNRMDNCFGITAFDVESGSTILKAIDGVLYNYTGTSLVLYPLGKPVTAYNIPEGVTDIGYRAFKVCTLAYIELPSSLLTIQGEAFSGCTSLKQLICKAVTPPNIIDNSTFFTTSSVAEILVGVPAASLSDYQLSKWIATVYAAGKGFTTTQLVAYRSIMLGDKVTCTQTLGIPTKSVSVTAGTPDAGKVFSNWTSTPTVTFADLNSSTTTFIMPDADVSIQAVYSGTTGLEKNEATSISIYPNPSSKYILLNGAIGSNYSIYDINGHLLIQGINNNKSISISQLNNGTYLLKAKNKTLVFLKK